MGETSLLDETLHLLKNAPRELTLVKIAAAIEVTPQWLSWLLSGKCKDAGVRKIEALNRYLKAPK